MRLTFAAAAIAMATSALSTSVLTTSAQAQIRVDPNVSSYIDPSSGQAARLLFGRSGYFMIAGGVVLGGSAKFYVEQNGIDRAVPASSVTLNASHDGSVSVTQDGVTYRVAMPQGLSCPLAHFVARDGIIAYTVPRYMDTDSRRAMMRAGLKHHRIAEEFDGTQFEPLLHAADFARTTPLPTATANLLTASLNNANDMAGFVIDAADETDKPIGSLINTDAQVQYHVYLNAATHAVEIAGVPLRYFWELDRVGNAGVFAVDALAQDWPAGTTLTNFSLPNAQPTQYDIVNFYQVAALFRQIHQTIPTQFEMFAAQTCNTTT